MLRDMCEDLPARLVNITAENLQARGISADEINGEPFRPWVREQVALARACFREGKTYIDSLDVLRCKLAGVWYCARFECVLHLIERDGFRLRAVSPERHGLRVWLEMVSLGAVVTLQHLADQVRAFTLRLTSSAGLNPRWNMPSYHIK